MGEGETQGLPRPGKVPEEQAARPVPCVRLQGAPSSSPPPASTAQAQTGPQDVSPPGWESPRRLWDRPTATLLRGGGWPRRHHGHSLMAEGGPPRPRHERAPCPCSLWCAPWGHPPADHPACQTACTKSKPKHGQAEEAHSAVWAEPREAELPLIPTGCPVPSGVQRLPAHSPNLPSGHKSELALGSCS